MSVVVHTFPTLAAAADALAHDRSARYFGGGTLLMRAVNESDQDVGTLVRSTDPELDRIRSSGQRLTLGAGVTMRSILASGDLDFLHPAARAIGGPAVQSQATIGGNVFAPHPYGDLATALLALDAEIEPMNGPPRPLADLLHDGPGSGRTVIRSLSFDRPTPGTFRFRKVTRVRPAGAPVLCIAARVPVSAGRIRDARIAWGAMGPRPVRTPAVERALEGCRLEAEDIAGAVAAAAADLSPPDDALASGWYRREVAPVHLRRLLLER